jgi:hypothetical protein
MEALAARGVARVARSNADCLQALPHLQVLCAAVVSSTALSIRIVSYFFIILCYIHVYYNEAASLRYYMGQLELEMSTITAG